MFHLFFLLFFVTCEASTVPQNCTNITNYRMNCIIEVGGAMVQCPKKNVIRIIGDYQHISIHCTYEGSLQFNYTGTKPTEAIRVNSWREVTLPDNTSIEPTTLRENIKVEVLSVVSLVEEYKETMKIQLSNLSTAIYYSRSGEFRFEASTHLDGTYVHSFFIFFEEPKVDPGFINRYELNEGWKVIDGTKYFVPCRSTHYLQPDGWGEPELWIFGGDKERPTETKYDPLTGFYVKMSNVSQLPAGSTPFHCVIPHKTNLSKTITFNTTSKSSACASSERYLCQKPRPKSKDSLLTYYKESKKGRFIATCTQDSKATLYFIESRNPDEQALVRDFVLPDFVNRSLYVEKGTLIKDKSKYTNLVETHRGTSLHFGAVYCELGTDHDLRSFVTNIKSDTSLTGLSHSIDWRVVQGTIDQSWDTDQLPTSPNASTLYFQITNTSQDKTVYDCDSLTFQCHIHPFFTRPVVWMIEQNENIKRQVEKDVTAEPSILQTRLEPGFANITCHASTWAWYGKWVNLTVSVTVLESKVPRFVEYQHPVYEFAPDTMQPLVKVLAAGPPNPSITCRAVSLGKECSGPRQDPRLVPQLTLYKADVTETTFKVNNLTEALLICEAQNARGKVNVTIEILVKCPSNTQIITISVSSSIALLFLLIIISVAIRYCIRRRRSYLRRMAIYKLIQNVGDSDSDEEEFLEEEEFPHLHPFDYDYEIDLNSFTFDESNCLAKTPVKHIYPGLFNTKAAVVKTTLKNAERSCTHALLTEYKIQIYLGYHPNLVQLIGGCTSYETHGRVFILEEFCEIGILRDFLRCNLGSFDPELGKTGTVPRRPHQKNARLSIQNLFDWSIQIVGAMEYLSEKGIIHRDLCTKNILMNSIHTVKIGGLEYARRLYAYPEYSDPRVGSTLSWRWMAVESIRDRIFSVKSDVWSMGVTLWEIFNYAEVPYGNKAKNMVMVYQLENGLRLEKPKCATELMHQKLLLHCWNANPDCRPNFAIIKELLKTFVKIPASSSRPGSFTNRMSSLLARV